jgi:hypothetical protein
MGVAKRVVRKVKARPAKKAKAKVVAKKRKRRVVRAAVSDAAPVVTSSVVTWDGSVGREMRERLRFETDNRGRRFGKRTVGL